MSEADEYGPGGMFSDGPNVEPDHGGEDVSERNDPRYIEDAAVGIAIYCDENGLTFDEGRALAVRVMEAVEYSAGSRSAYLNAGPPS